MAISRRDALFAGAAALPASGLFLGLARGQTSPAVGQPAPNNRQPPAPQPGGTQPTGQPGNPQQMGEDPLLAACLLLVGRRQIEVCRFDLDRLQNADVKAFAKAEIDEHEGLKAKLKSMGYEYPTAPQLPQGAPRPAGQQSGNAGMPPVLAVGRIIFPPGLSGNLKLEDEVVTQCVASYKTNMGKKEGAKLDKAFVGDQLHEHYGLKDKATVFTRHATQQMQTALKEAMTVIDRHIATLEDLMVKVDRQG